MANLIIYNYLQFIREKGRPVSEIIPGSEEFALSIEDAMQAIELLNGSQTAILGGDILSDKGGKLIYAYHYWGDGYHVLNWSYRRKMDNESQEEYFSSSYVMARDKIKEASEIAKSLEKSCYIVLVI